jgi:hypothetical protein
MSSTSICPKGHSSSENDFCSECGAKIQSAAGVMPNNPNPGRLCPDCNAPAPAAGINFCEICGYNFVTQTSGQFPAPIKESPPPPPPPPVPAADPTAFMLAISVDATLRTAASPEEPPLTAPFVYSVDKPVSLVGRKSEARAIFPEISLDSDTAVSHRHGLISQTPEGLLIYRDLGSANGTRLNGADVTPLVDTPLKIGDHLTLGHWTRIVVEPQS